MALEFGEFPAASDLDHFAEILSIATDAIGRIVSEGFQPRDDIIESRQSIRKIVRLYHPATAYFLSEASGGNWFSSSDANAIPPSHSPTCLRVSSKFVTIRS